MTSDVPVRSSLDAYESEPSAFSRAIYLGQGSRTHSSHHRHQFSANHLRFRQREQRLQLRCSFCETAVAHFREPELQLVHPDHVVDHRSNAGLEPLNRIDQAMALLHVQQAALARSPSGVPGRAGRVWAFRHILLARVRNDDLFFTVQQLVTQRHVVDVGCRARHRMCPSWLGVCARVSLHAEEQLISLLRLMHFRIALNLFVFRRIRYRDKRRTDDRASFEHQSAVRKNLVDGGQDRVFQMMPLQHVREPQDYALVGQVAHLTFQPSKFAVRRYVVQRLFHRWIAQTAPLLKQVHTKQRVHLDMRATDVACRLVRCAQRRQHVPLHPSFHFFDELALARPRPRQAQRKVCSPHHCRRARLRVHIIASLRRKAGGYIDTLQHSDCVKISWSTYLAPPLEAAVLR
jgi:hypothetical protein